MLKRKLFIERKITLTTELEINAYDEKELAAKTQAMQRAVSHRGVKALPPVTWDLKDSSIEVVEVEDA